LIDGHAGLLESQYTLKSDNRRRMRHHCNKGQVRGSGAHALEVQAFKATVDQKQSKLDLWTKG
jgi:hypothetical protein